MRRAPRMRGVATGVWALAGAVVAVVGWPGVGVACKPPPSIAERLEFTLVRVVRDGQPAPLAGVPAQVVARAITPTTLQIVGVGDVHMREAPAVVPAKVAAYIRRQRRIGRAACVTFIFREPAIPGRYVRELEAGMVDGQGARWDALWPAEAPLWVVLDPSRSTLLLQVEEGPQGALELEYRLTRSRFRDGCAIASEAPPWWLVALALLAVRRRRVGRRGMACTG